MQLCANEGMSRQTVEAEQRLKFGEWEGDENEDSVMAAMKIFQESK
jgi:hypothetical protein